MKKRRIPSVNRLLTIDAPTVMTPKSRTLEISATRRPSRSPTTPAIAPPTIIPTNPAARVGANELVLAIFQSFAIDGMATPSNWLSMPSMTTLSAVMRTTNR